MNLQMAGFSEKDINELIGLVTSYNCFLHSTRLLLKVVLWTLLTAIYEDELIEEPHGRETIIENIETEGAASC